MADNPYQTPAANIGGQQSISTGDGVSPEVVDMLVRTRPWTLFLAILGFIMVGVIVLVALSTMSTGISAGVAMGLVNLAVAVIYILPSIKLLQYSSAITNLRIYPNSQSLEIALDRQRSFWKTMGIFAMIGIILMVIGIILGVSAASSAPTYRY